MFISYIIYFWSFRRFGLPADRLWVSVYEDDDEAFTIWQDEASEKKCGIQIHVPIVHSCHISSLL